MLSACQTTCDGHLGYITAAKYRIKLLDNHAKSVHLAPYPAGPETREFEKAELDKIPDQKIIEPAQTEWATPIVFAPKKNGLFKSVLTIGSYALYQSATRTLSHRWVSA